MTPITQIKTSAKNKELVTRLTRKFALGTENVIARIAIAYSLKSGVRFAPTDVKDAGGKEYSKNVLFGKTDGATFLNGAFVVKNAGNQTLLIRGKGLVQVHFLGASGGQHIAFGGHQSHGGL